MKSDCMSKDEDSMGRLLHELLMDLHTTKKRVKKKIEYSLLKRILVLPLYNLLSNIHVNLPV